MPYILSNLPEAYKNIVENIKDKLENYVNYFDIKNIPEYLLENIAKWMYKQKLIIQEKIIKHVRKFTIKRYLHNLWVIQARIKILFV